MWDDKALTGLRASQSRLVLTDISSMCRKYFLKASLGLPEGPDNSNRAKARDDVGQGKAAQSHLKMSGQQLLPLAWGGYIRHAPSLINLACCFYLLLVSASSLTVPTCPCPPFPREARGTPKHVN